MILKIVLSCLIIIFLIGCAETPSHTNIYDPETPNNPPNAVELKSDLINYITNNSIEFEWTESGDEDFFRYNVYRSDQPGVDTNSTLLASHPYPFLTSIKDTGLIANTSYYYKVYTEDKGGRATASNEFRIMTAPDIFYIGVFGQQREFGNEGYISKIAVISHNNVCYTFFARLTRDWDLEICMIDFDMESVEQKWNKPFKKLISGDSDNDGEPDMYEIYQFADPDDPDVKPEVNYLTYPLISPTQIAVIKDENSTNITLFVLFGRNSIFKFNGDLNSSDYSLDITWHDNGMLRLDYFYWMYSISIFSPTQLLVANGPQIVFCSIEGDELSIIDVEPYWASMITVGKDTPSGQKYIYICEYPGFISKIDETGTRIDKWPGIPKRMDYLATSDLYADYNGNVFIIDCISGTVNKFNSSGELLCKWYEIETWNMVLSFTKNLGEFGHVSITGDKEKYLFFVDQSPAMFCTEQ